LETGFIVLRGDKIVYSSLPSAVESLESSLSEQMSAPNPLVAKSAVIDVEEEDLIVLATDGLWDNVTDCQVRKSESEFVCFERGVLVWRSVQPLTSWVDA